MSIGAKLVRVHDLLDLVGRHIGLESFEQVPKTAVTSRGRARDLGENCCGVVHDLVYPEDRVSRCYEGLA